MNVITEASHPALFTSRFDPRPGRKDAEARTSTKLPVNEDLLLIVETCADHQTTKRRTSYMSIERIFQQQYKAG